MINGVKLKQITKHCDDRGFFAELVRNDEDLLSQFGQWSLSKSYPGVIKAFHYHKEQDDVWFFVGGNVQVVLYDLREESPTNGETQVCYMGEDNPLILMIPAGVAHGYRVLGETPVVMLYLTTKAYQPERPDEYRLAYNDPLISFNWETKHR